MLIGLISDTHDNLSNIIKAKERFKQKKVDFVIHCGDISSISTIQYFNGLKVIFVKGNCDYNPESIKKEVEKIKCEYKGEIYKTQLKDKNNTEIAVTHGNNAEILDQLIKSNKYDFILTGHTHKTEDKIIKKTRMLNPGAHKNGENTIMIINTDKKTVETITLK